MYCFCSYCDSAVVRNVLRVYRNYMLIASPFLPQMHTNTNGIPSSTGDHPHYASGWTFQHPKHTCANTDVVGKSCKQTHHTATHCSRYSTQQSSVSLTTSTWCIESSFSVTSCLRWKSPYKYSCLAKHNNLGFLF